MAAELTPTRSSCTGQATIQEREASRKDAFKRKRTPNWRNTYRERCASRLKRNRQLLFDQNRGQSSSPLQENVTESVYSVMQEEWDQLRSELHLPNVSIGGKRTALSPMVGNNLPKRAAVCDEEVGEGFITPPRQRRVCHAPSYNEDEPEEDIEYILSLMDEITQELIVEEQSIVAQYEDELRYSEAALSSVIDSLSQDDDNCSVICPICLKSVLIQEQQIIYCTCGLRIDTEQDGITLDYVRRQLEEGSLSHSQQCPAVPSFKADGILGLRNLIMTCTACDYMFIVL